MTTNRTLNLEFNFALALLLAGLVLWLPAFYPIEMTRDTPFHAARAGKGVADALALSFADNGVWRIAGNVLIGLGAYHTPGFFQGFQIILHLLSGVLLYGVLRLCRWERNWAVIAGFLFIALPGGSTVAQFADRGHYVIAGVLHLLLLLLFALRWRFPSRTPGGPLLFLTGFAISFFSLFVIEVALTMYFVTPFLIPAFSFPLSRWREWNEGPRWLLGHLEFIAPACASVLYYLCYKMFLPETAWRSAPGALDWSAFVGYSYYFLEVQAVMYEMVFSEHFPALFREAWSLPLWSFLILAAFLAGSVLLFGQSEGQFESDGSPSWTGFLVAGAAVLSISALFVYVKLLGGGRIYYLATPCFVILAIFPLRWVAERLTVPVHPGAGLLLIALVSAPALWANIGYIRKEARALSQLTDFALDRKITGPVALDWPEALDYKTFPRREFRVQRFAEQWAISYLTHYRQSGEVGLENPFIFEVIKPDHQTGEEQVLIYRDSSWSFAEGERNGSP